MLAHRLLQAPASCTAAPHRLHSCHAGGSRAHTHVSHSVIAAHASSDNADRTDSSGTTTTSGRVSPADHIPPHTPTPLSTLTSMESLKLALDAERSLFGPEAVQPLVHHLVQVLWLHSPQGLLEAALLGDVLPAVYAVIADTLEGMQPRDQAHVAVLLSQLRSCDSAVLLRLAEAARRRDGFVQIPAADLAALLSALADHNARPSQGWLGALMSDLQNRMHQLPGSSLVQLLWGLVRLGVRPTSAWLASFVAAEGLQTLTGLSAPDLATLSRAFGEISFQPPQDWLDTYLGAVQQLLPSFCPQELSELAWGLSRLRVEPPGTWGTAFLQSAEQRMPQLRTSDLVMLTVAVADLKLRPGKVWLDVLMSQSLRLMAQFSPRELAELLPAVVHLHQAATPGRESTQSSDTAAAATLPSAAAAAAAESPAAGPGPSPSAAASAPTPRSIHRLGPLMMQPSQSLPSGPGVGAGSGPGSESLSGPGPGSPLLDPSWMAALLDCSRFKLGRFPAQSLPLLLRSICEAGAQPDAAWLTMFTEVASSKVDVLSSPDLCRLYVSLGLDMGHMPRDTQHRRALAVQLAGRLAELPGELQLDVLTLLTRLGSTLQLLYGPSPSTEPEPRGPWARAHAWRRLVLQSTLAQLPHMSERQLGAVMVAAVKLELSPSVRWVQACVQEVYRRLRGPCSFTAETLVPVVWAMTMQGEAVRACSPRLVRFILAKAYRLSHTA